jgi:formamidopyrimidine-DNA glycosylase
MPELPDLEVIREVLLSRLVGEHIVSADVRRPIIVRDMTGRDWPSLGDWTNLLTGKRFTDVSRRGKFLLLALDGDLFLVINPMLAGRLRYGAPLAKDRTRDALVLRLASGNELRYNDQADMGKIYLTADVNAVPAFAEQGPDADDPALTLELFQQRLKRHTGEIKGALTNQAFVAGIGNAYADEILWCARIYPFRRRASLSQTEIERLYMCMRTVLAKAVETLRERVGERIEVEVRDFLAVHNRTGESCPRCGNTISEVKREKRVTNFCRACQPGLMVDR